jgi:hypothetical protein
LWFIASTESGKHSPRIAHSDRGVSLGTTEAEIPPCLRGKIQCELEPVFVTGEREPLHETIGKAIIKQSPWMKRRAVPTNAAELIELVENVHDLSSKGIFLILDELGKNLEHAMMEPASSDVY